MSLLRYTSVLGKLYGWLKPQLGLTILSLNVHMHYASANRTPREFSD
jgi:hypothetical protein